MMMMKCCSCIRSTTFRVSLTGGPTNKQKWNPSSTFHPKRLPSILHRSFSSSTPSTSQNTNNTTPLCLVDLRGAGWSILERLCLEEFLAATKTQMSWLIVGMHEATEHRHLHLTKPAPTYIQRAIVNEDGHEYYNPSCAILLGSQSGDNKNIVAADVNVPMVERDGILCLQHSDKSSSFLGESVVLDHDAIVTTLITTNLSSSSSTKAAPVELLTRQIWQPTFAKLESLRLKDATTDTTTTTTSSKNTMVLDTKSCSKGDNSGRLVTLEDLGITTTSTIEDEDDEEYTSKLKPGSPLPLLLEPPHYYRLGDFPIGMVHATTSQQQQQQSSPSTIVRSVFWWDYDRDHVTLYLKNPPPNSIKSSKMPFLKLQDIYPQANPSKVAELLLQSCRESNYFGDDGSEEVTQMNSRDILKLMAQEKTSLQDWWEHKSSWKIVQQF